MNTHAISSSELNEIREQMLKFAELQLRDRTLAEDLVQEALLNALKNIDAFKRQSALKTWIFAILKNKIIDFLRQKDRVVLESDLAFDDEDEPNHFFDQVGHWNKETAPQALQADENSVYSEEFWLLFEVCLSALPSNQARVFMMREYLEVSAEEICKEIAISTSNLYTMLYRARLQLQHCLAKKL